MPLVVVHSEGRQEHVMRVVGRRQLPAVGLRGPTPDEVRASVENALRAPRVIPKGVYRYRTHAEANADMDRWTTDALVARAQELDLGPGR